MNRQIKFRGKRSDNGKWITGYYRMSFWMGGGGVDEAAMIMLSDASKEFEVDPETIGQFTGLKDTHKNDIYEGDFLKLIDEYRGKGERPSYVIFNQNQWMLQGTMHYSHKESINNYSLDKMEIIGNVYENPELLNN